MNIDKYLLNHFQNISHNYQRRKGKTNYYLAWLFCYIAGVFYFINDLFIFKRGINIIMMVILFYFSYLYDSREQNFWHSKNNLLLNRNPELYKNFRYIALFFALLTLPHSILQLFVLGDLSGIFDMLFVISVLIMVYFASCEPLDKTE